MPNRDPTCAACVFLLILLLTPVSPECRKGTADECREALPAPISQWSGQTFNILELTTPTHRPDVFQGKTSDGGCTLCENPLLEGKPLQRIPMFVADWKAYISCPQKVHHSIHHSAIAVAEALTKLYVKNDWRAELDVKISPSAKTQLALAGSRSTMTQECAKMSLEDKYIFLLHHTTCLYYTFHINKDFKRHEAFENDVKHLPETYDPSSKEEYRRFIRMYGTHFETEIDMGAHVRHLRAVSMCEAMMDGVSVSELSRCLAVDLAINFGFDGVINSPDFQMCKEKKKKNPNFYRPLRYMGSVQRGGKFSDTYKEWVESAKSHPVKLSYSLEPLHTLVAKNDPRREGLRQAVSEYVRERALRRNCNKPCPPGTQPSASDFCSCECPSNNITNSLCCSQKRGLARLMVTIEYAKELRGDIFTQSDGYVKVFFQNRWMCTHTVWNDDNPMWNVTLDFGVIQLHTDFRKLHVEVWDEDFGWNDDRLGMCDLSLEAWVYRTITCYLTASGRLYLKYRLACGPHLGGPTCSRYSSPWPNYESYS